MNTRARNGRAGAESVDAARAIMWTGCVMRNKSIIRIQGGNFNVDEAAYRLGFEAARSPGSTRPKLREHTR